MANTEMPQSILSIQGLHKSYGKGSARNHVIRGIDLEIVSGEFISIVGTSGSGKTTLLNILGGLDRDFEGRVLLRGHDVQHVKDKTLSRLRNETIGFVFQAFNLLPHLTCIQNVMVPGVFSQRSDPGAEERAAGLLEELGLADKLEVKPTELSGGQKQRVSIARALFNQPMIILCDEPTGSLDHQTSKQIVSLFRRLSREENLTFVIVTHDEHLSRACDRIIRLADGEVISDKKRVRDSEEDLTKSSDFSAVLSHSIESPS